MADPLSTYFCYLHISSVLDLLHIVRALAASSVTNCFFEFRFTLYLYKTNSIILFKLVKAVCKFLKNRVLELCAKNEKALAGISKKVSQVGGMRRPFLC